MINKVELPVARQSPCRSRRVEAMDATGTQWLGSRQRHNQAIWILFGIHSALVTAPICFVCLFGSNT